MPVRELQTPKTAIPMPLDDIAEFCRKWKLTEFSLFGSILREDFRPDSDIDVLVSYSPNAAHTLFTWVEMQEELERLLGRKVDLLGKRGVELSRNPHRRKAILESARVLHAA